jgi:hypothetical protein
MPWVWGGSTAPGQWTYVALVYDGEHLSLYQNSVRTARVKTIGPWTVQNPTFQNSSVTESSVLIDSVAIWTSVLDDAQLETQSLIGIRSSQ